MAEFVRALCGEDLPALVEIDRSYAAALDLEPLLEAAVVSFYARSGHSFVLDSGGSAAGFALAQAVWDGRRPTLHLSRLAVNAGAGEQGRSALLEAVVKSAYDAGVYDLLARQPAADREGARALARHGFAHLPQELYGLTLGSRSRGG